MSDEIDSEVPNYIVDSEVKYRKKFAVKADGINEAEEKIIDYINDNDHVFSEDDRTEISVTAGEIRYPFQSLSDTDFFSSES